MELTNLMHPGQQGAWILNKTGLDDDAARTFAWFSLARQRRETAEAALRELAGFEEVLRRVMTELTAAVEEVRTTSRVDWRGDAAAAYRDAVGLAVGTAEALEAEVREWFALRESARSEAEDLRAAAEARERQIEEQTLLGLRALAGAS